MRLSQADMARLGYGGTDMDWTDDVCVKALGLIGMSYCTGLCSGILEIL